MFFPNILLVFLIPNVFCDKWFMDVFDRYTSLHMRPCLFGKMNETHYHLQHVVVPNLVQGYSDEPHKNGCGIDATKCISKGILKFGIYENDDNVAWARTEAITVPNIGYSNDRDFIKNFSGKYTMLRTDKRNKTLECLSKISEKYVNGEQQRINKYNCPLTNGSEVAVTDKELCELSLIMKDNCKIEITQRAVPTSSRRKLFHEGTTNEGNSVNLYCTGNFCPLMLLGASVIYERFHGNGVEPVCLREIQAEIKKKQSTWDSKICETIKKYRNSTIMKDEMWDELLTAYTCNPSSSNSAQIPATSSSTAFPIEPATQQISLEPIMERNTGSSNSESAQGSTGSSTDGVEPLEESTIVVNVDEVTTTYDSKADSNEISAKEHSMENQASGEDFATADIIVMIFTWLGIIITSCIFVYVLFKFDPAELIA